MIEFLFKKLPFNPEMTATAMLKAVEVNNMEICKYLYRFDRHTAIEGYGEFHPLGYAAVFNRLDIFKFLYSKEKDEMTIFRMVDGWNVLHTAASYGHFKIVKFICEELNETKRELIRTETTSDPYENALELALGNGHNYVASYLQKYFDKKYDIVVDDAEEQHDIDEDDAEDKKKTTLSQGFYFSTDLERDVFKVHQSGCQNNCAIL